MLFIEYVLIYVITGENLSNGKRGNVCMCVCVCVCTAAIVAYIAKSHLPIDLGGNVTRAGPAWATRTPKSDRRCRGSSFLDRYTDQGYGAKLTMSVVCVSRVYHLELEM